MNEGLSKKTSMLSCSTFRENTLSKKAAKCLSVILSLSLSSLSCGFVVISWNTGSQFMSTCLLVTPLQRKLGEMSERVT